MFLFSASRRLPRLGLLSLTAAWWVAVVAHAQQPVGADGVPLDPYRAGRTPVVTIAAQAGPAGGINARLAKLSALASGDPAPAPTPPVALQALGGVFGEVSLGYLDGSGKAPAPATVTLQFDAARAGASVWVQPLDGGAILTPDANGNPTSFPAGTFLTLSATGAVTFSFQAPSHTGRFQVILRLDTVSSTLPFVILDPAADN